MGVIITLARMMWFSSWHNMRIPHIIKNIKYEKTFNIGCILISLGDMKKH